MTVKRFLTWGLILAATFALAACSGSSGNAGSVDVKIKGEDIKYDITTIQAKVGQTVNVTFENVGALDHTFVIADLNFTLKAKAGETVTGSFTPTTAGTFDYHCDVAGHTAAGMVGQLIVSP